jgi:outer membrane immunogenic protein
MKRLFLSAVAFSAVAVGPALAADLPRKAPAYVPPAPPPYNWTGFYVGLNGGYSWGKATVDVDAPFLSGLPFTDPSLLSLDSRVSSGNLKPKGGIFGGQLGYNWQVGPSWVWGVETDIQWSGQKNTRNGAAAASGSGVFCNEFEGAGDVDCHTLTDTASTASSIQAKLTWFGTARLRGGVLVTPTTLLYATGGLAYGGTKISGTVAGTTTRTCTNGAEGDECADVGIPPTQTASAAGTFSRSRTNVGWTVGAGVEGAAFWAPNWTWKVEYLYMDLGTDNLNNINGTGLFVGNNIRFTDNIVRAGLNYRFGY